MKHVKITGLETFLVGYYPDTFPGNFLLVKVSTDEGISGVGECYASNNARTVEAAVKELERYLLGKDPLMIEHHWQAMDIMPYFTSGWILRSAMAGLEIALWDIAGKFYKAPIYKLLGGPTRKEVRTYADVFHADREKTIEKWTAFAKEGYTAVKSNVLRWKEGRVMKDDDVVKENVDMVKAFRDNIGYEVDIALDAASRLTPRTAIKLCNALEDYMPLFIEEPIRSDKIETLARIAANTSVPIAAGERIYSPLDFRRLLDKGAVDIIQPDISLTGLMQARKIAAIAETYDVAVAPHNPLSYIQWAASVQLDACIPNFAIQEVIPEGSVRKPDPIREEIVVKPIPVERGVIKVTADPGLGVELNESALKKYPYRPYSRPLRLHDDGSVSDATFL